jgi:DNA-binding transcriptional MerR regulator
MLRHFEQQGLLDPSRSQSDYREYESKHEALVFEIREWQRLGLTLREIKIIKTDSSLIDKVLAPVFIRVRDVFVQKERALRDLSERPMIRPMRRLSNA